MAQSLRGLRWRTAVVLVGGLTALLWMAARGGSPGYLIQIDYSWSGDFLDSAQVIIDGEPAGLLLRYGKGQRVTGFEVEAGEHEVLVQMERCEGIPRTVTLSPSETRFVLLMADLDDGYRCRIQLR